MGIVAVDPSSVPERPTLVERWGPWYGLAVLSLVGLLAMVDRQVYVLQADPIKQSLALTDFQLGLLQGFGVSLFAAAAAYPFGWAADRFDRRLVLVFGVVVWSAAVAASAYAASFAFLFIAASLVAAGEAAFAPVANALIPQWFQGSRRLLANSVFVIAGRLFAGASIAVCAQLILAAEWLRAWFPTSLAALDGWRLTLLLAAAMAPVFILLILSAPTGGRVAPRGQAVPSTQTPATTRSLIAHLGRHRRVFIGFYVGVGLASFSFVAIAAWLPVAAGRLFGASPAEIGNAFGAASTVAMLCGLGFMALAPRWLRPRLGPALPILVLVWATLLAGLTAALLPLAQDVTSLFGIAAVHLSFATVGAMVYLTVLQDLAPASLRARLAAVSVITQALLSACAAPLVGWISDRLPQPQGLLQALVGVSVTGFVVSALMLQRCVRDYVNTVEAAAAP